MCSFVQRAWEMVQPHHVSMCALFSFLPLPTLQIVAILVVSPILRTWKNKVKANVLEIRSKMIEIIGKCHYDPA